MENELRKKVYQMIQRLGKNKRPKRAAYTDADIVLTYLWAVLHDRPIYWACQKSNWPIYHRRKNLPNPSNNDPKITNRSCATIIVRNRTAVN